MPASRSPRGVYKMGTIARLTGFTPAVLRAWERRFSLLDPQRLESGHRLYTDDDLRVLRRVRDLMQQGRAIGEIAQIGRKQLLDGGAPSLPARSASPAPAPLLRHPAPSTDGRGARSQRTELTGHRRALVEAAVAIDSAAIERALDQAFALVAPEVAINEVIVPASIEIGELWARGACSVAGEHIASAAIRTRLHRLLDMANPTNGEARPRAVCACLPDEHHENGLLIVAYNLARMGWSVSYLGASLPLEDLERAVRQVQPQAVYLSVTRQALLQAHKPKLLDFVQRHNDGIAFFVGGGEFAEDDQELLAAGINNWNREHAS